jgi:hypothetical protein
MQGPECAPRAAKVTKKLVPLDQALLDGLRIAVDRHWFLAKDMLEVKPECILTVYLAERLSEGFDNISGIDLLIKLEEKTRKVVLDIWMLAAGFRRYFKSGKWKGRNGKVDIFVKRDIGHDCYVVEVKNFDPAAGEIRKELIRFRHLLEINSSKNTLKSCHLVFPTSTDKSNWIQKQIKKFDPDQLKLTAISCRHDTGEDPEDGIPTYHCNLISMTN